MESYWLLNAGISLNPSSGPWHLSLIGKNLTDNIYATLGNDHAGGTGDVAAVAGDSRTVAVQLEYKF